MTVKTTAGFFKGFKGPFFWQPPLNIWSNPAWVGSKKNWPFMRTELLFRLQNGLLTDFMELSQPPILDPSRFWKRSGYLPDCFRTWLGPILSFGVRSADFLGAEIGFSSAKLIERAGDAIKLSTLNDALEPIFLLCCQDLRTRDVNKNAVRGFCSSQIGSLWIWTLPLKSPGFQRMKSLSFRKKNEVI